MRALRVGAESAPFVSRTYGWTYRALLAGIVGLFAVAVYALANSEMAAESDLTPATLAMLLVGFVLLVASLRARRR